MPILLEKKILPSLIIEFCYKQKLFYNIFYKVLMWSIFYWFLSRSTINITFSFTNNHLTRQLIIFLLGREEISFKDSKLQHSIVTIGSVFLGERRGIIQRFQTTTFNGHCRISFVLFASLKIKLSC